MPISCLLRKMGELEQPSPFECALPYYGIQLPGQSFQNGSILYHPNNCILNYALLDAVKKAVSNGHVLVIAPTEYAVSQLIQFLKRHLLTDSIDSHRSEQNRNKWPEVIVMQNATLLELYGNGFDINLELVVVLECQDAMQDEALKKFVDYLRFIGSKQQTKVLCFTSCIVSNFCEPGHVRLHIKQQEEFYGCKLTPIYDHHVAERIFPSSVQSLNVFEKQENWNESCGQALRLLNEAKDLCSNFNFCVNENFSQIANVSCDEFVKNTLTEIQNQMEELGEYGGSIGAMKAFTALVRLYTFAGSTPGSITKYMLSSLVCSLAKFRKILEDDMFRVQVSERAERFSSKKIQSLLSHLKDMPMSHRSLIIVQNHHTASILTLILQKIADQGKKHKHVKPKLMLNSHLIPLSDSWEDILDWEHNVEVNSLFVSGNINTVVLSGEPQGIDLPCCDIVVVWEKIEHFSQLVKAKNFVKEKSGRLLLFVEKTSLTSYQEEMEIFKTMEEELTVCLTGGLKSDKLQVTSKNSFMTRSGIEVREDKAINVLKQYFETLPHDKFTTYWPVWMMEKVPSSPLQYIASLFLPIVCPIKSIKSSKCNSWEAAQQNAAWKACQNLYEANELNDDILLSCSGTGSKRPQPKVNEKSDVQSHFESELGLKNVTLASLQGTEQKEDEDNLCDIIFPQWLASAQPRSGVETYLHKLVIYPVSESPHPGDNRKTVLYELLCDKHTFAILSSKPLLEVCEFPIFLYGHELSVKIETYNSRRQFDQNELNKLRIFHCGQFMKVLPIVQNFMQYDIYNGPNSYLIAPLDIDGDIDWDVVENHTSIPECQELTHEEKMNFVCNRETHERTMVKPYYRYLNREQVYLVSQVCSDMNAESCFPTEEFESFMEYFRGKYHITLERPELPLLEVYLINTKINGLSPRSRSHKMRREEKMEDFKEHLVPELCMPLLFPAALWLKLASLPSVLHRLNRLLLMEEFRRLIVKETGVGSLHINFNSLKVNISSLKDGSLVPKVPPSIETRGLAIGNVKLEHRKKMAQLKKPWKEIPEPVDIHRHMTSLNFFEIRYFEEYRIKSKLSNLSLPCHEEASSIPKQTMGFHDLIDDPFSSGSTSTTGDLPQQEESLCCPKVITLLKSCGDNDCGPQLDELLAVFTSSCSSDVVTMDQFQVLGNSFLTLAISVYAYMYGLNIAGGYTSSCLQKLRSTFMSTNHLERCSMRKGLSGRIKVLDFTPGEWIPPCFVTPSMLKSVLKEEEISPNVLQQINLTEAEQLMGILEEGSQTEIQEVLCDFVNRGTSRREEAYIDRQNVPSKTSASCVEALVGAYFKNCGWQGALKVVGWLELLPSTKLDKLLDYQTPLPKESLSIELPIVCKSLEQRLLYNFVDKTLLIQAITHESYLSSSLSSCLDTLAFLGSGVLDFIFTCYIYEHCSELSPPQMWRLREVLSSTSTLAYLAVRHGIHKYLLVNSASLLDAVDRFVKLQKGCQHPINDEVQLLFEEHECENPLQVEMPSVLGKLLPSLVGAVYLDCGKNLGILWELFKGIFLPELDLWRQDIPLSVVDLLKDMSPAAHQVIFTTTTKDHGMFEVSCKVLMDNTSKDVFSAIGTDENKTKTHAAKLALRNLLGSTYFCY